MDQGTGAAAPTAGLRATLPRRLRAAGIHFAISLAIFAVAMYLMLVHWYPGFHFTVDGGWQGTRIMVGVDLVLGPLLTLIIFNPRKARRLIVLDLGCIAAIQLAALAWGFYAIEGQRPVGLNFHDGLFYSMTAHAVRAQPGAAEALERLSDRKPALLYVAVPATPEERARAHARTDRRLMAHEDAYFFRPFAAHWDEIQYFAVDPAKKSDPAFARELPDFLAEHGGTAADYRFFRYQAGYGSCFIALTSDGVPVGALACDAD